MLVEVFRLYGLLIPLTLCTQDARNHIQDTVAESEEYGAKIYHFKDTAKRKRIGDCDIIYFTAFWCMPFSSSNTQIAKLSVLTLFSQYYLSLKVV